MKNLTQDSIVRNIIAMAAPIAAGMLFQTLYFLVDLYFVAAIGDAAVAGVGAAGTLMFIVMALTQVLGVGAVALIAQAVGRKDQADANLVFNQSVLFAFLCAAVTLIGGYALRTRTSARSPPIAKHQRSGTTYLYWFLPGLALGFAQVTMGSAMRGTGIVKPTMAIQAFTVLLNALLAPVLIAGWGTGLRDGRRGRGAREHVVDRDRRGPARALFLAAREVRVVSTATCAPADQRLEAHARRRPARGRRVRADVHLHGRDLLGDQRFRRGGAGRLRHRLADHAVDLHARDGDRVRGRRRSPARISARARPTRVRETF